MNELDEYSELERWIGICAQVGMHTGWAPDDFVWDLQDPGWKELYEAGYVPYEACRLRFNLH